MREHHGKYLFNKECLGRFYVMPASKTYWFADPMIYMHDNKTFVFMEAFNRNKQKGEIVCSEIINGKIGDIIPVIEEDYHMSFPNIFSVNGEIYMLPEAEASNGVVLYRCERFPDKWVKVFYFETDIPVVDSVIYKKKNNCIYIQASTYDENTIRRPKFYYYQLNISGNGIITFEEDTQQNSIPCNAYDNRNAGRYIEANEGLLHCTQRSTDAIYGYSLKFYPSYYEKETIKDNEDGCVEILPSDIRLKNSKDKIIGIHTYDTVGRYEVIDVEYLEWIPDKWIKRINSRIKKYMRK